MKFGCNTLYPRGRWNGATCRFGRSEICESIDMLKAVGYEAVEFSFFLHLNAEDEEYVRNYCLSQNIIPWSAHSWSEIAATSEQLETETANLKIGRAHV